MPDTISRIRLEAQGADQAAREIRKLEEAYRRVQIAAQGLSPGSIMGGDAFSKATTPNSGVMAGGQTSADVAEREARNRRQTEDSRERQRQNAQYNAALRRTSGLTRTGFDVAEAAGSGRGGSAVGGIAAGLGSLLSGPLGIGLAVAGIAGMGIQRFAESSQARLQNVFGTGMSQRLGATYADTQNFITGVARTGVPMEMIQGIMSSASAAGAQFNRDTAERFGLMANLAADFGVDPGTLGALIGAEERGGFATARGTLRAGLGTFGPGGMGTFLTELTRTIENAMQSGIQLSQEEIDRRGNVIAGYMEFGGLTQTGATALNQMVESRAQQASLLSRPEDIVAFQAVRQANPNMTIVDVLRTMEANPTATNQNVLQYLQRATGGNQDELYLRLRNYLGGNATIGQIDAFIENMGRDIPPGAGAGLPQAALETQDREGRMTQALVQVEGLKGVQDAALELTTALNRVTSWLANPEGISLDATNVAFRGVRRELLQAAETAVSEVDSLTVQDVSNLTAEIDSANLTIRESRQLPGFVADPNFATNASTIRSLRENEALQRTVDTAFALSAPGHDVGWRRLQEGGFEAFGGGVGSFQNLFEQILTGVRAGAFEAIEEDFPGWRNRGERREEQRELTDVLSQFLSMNITTADQLQTAITDLIATLGEQGFVYSDGGVDHRE